MSEACPLPKSRAIRAWPPPRAARPRAPCDPSCDTFSHGASGPVGIGRSLGVPKGPETHMEWTFRVCRGSTGTAAQGPTPVGALCGNPHDVRVSFDPSTQMRASLGPLECWRPAPHGYEAHRCTTLRVVPTTFLVGGTLTAFSGVSDDPAQRRLALLVRAGELFHRSLDLESTLWNVARTCVEAFADLCLFDLIEETTNRLYVSVAAHHDPQKEASLKELVTPILQGETRGTHPARHVAQTGESFFVPVFDETKLLEHASSDAHEAFMRQLQYRSKMVVPVAAQGTIFGALTFVRTTRPGPFDDDDLQMAKELGRRAGLAVGNAKQYAREHATQQRLTLLVRAGELFHRSLDLDETLGNVARTSVESFADLCLFDLIDDKTNRLYVSVGAHRDSTIEPSLAALVTPILQAETRGVHPARHVAQTGESFFVPSSTKRRCSNTRPPTRTKNSCAEWPTARRSSFRSKRKGRFSGR